MAGFTPHSSAVQLVNRGRDKLTRPEGNSEQVTHTYLLESLEKEKDCTPAVWPFNSKALVTSLKSPFLLKHTSHTFTSGVKPQDATNLHEQEETQAVSHRGPEQGRATALQTCPDSCIQVWLAEFPLFPETCPFLNIKEGTRTTQE